MTRKEIAKDFLKLASGGQPRKAFGLYVSDNFKHHNAYFKGDRETLRLAMKDAHVQSPNKSYEAKRVLEDGDLIAVHGRIVLASDDKELNVVHIFRFEGDKIAEEWETGAEVPGDSLNENGAF